MGGRYGSILIRQLQLARPFLLAIHTINRAVRVSDLYPTFHLSYCGSLLTFPWLSLKNISPNNQVPASLSAIRLSLGVIYFHFGFLKFFQDLSPAELLASYTGQRLAWQWLSSDDALFLIAVLECFIGLCFLFNMFLRWMAPLFFFHMAATFLPLFFFPELVFKFAPFAPDMEGQYILKNLVLISAGWAVLAPHIRTFRLFSGLKRETPIKKNSFPLEPASHSGTPTASLNRKEPVSTSTTEHSPTVLLKD